MKKDLIKALICGIVSISSTTLMAQSTPGGIGTTNLTAWFRAGDLTLGNVSSWSTAYPTGAGAITLTESGGALPSATNTPTNGTSNYNTTIDFVGNALGASMKALENSSTLNLLNNNSSGNQGTFLCVYYLPVAQTGAGHMVMYRESSANSTDGIQLRTSLSGSTGRLALGSNTNSANASDDWTEEFKPSIIGYKGNRSNTTSMTSFKRSKNFSGGNASGTTGNVGLRFGVQNTGGTSYTGLYEGFLSEVIFYNVDLSAVELSKVNTYLAIKYAITLDNTSGGTQGDYVSTSGLTIWDADNNTGYHNDVIGLGRDDIEGLNQKQSHAFDDSVRIYISALSATNEGNLGTFNADVSYVTVGHNAGLLCGTASSNAEAPSGITSRLAREFKVTKTNFDQDFSIDIQIDTCSNIDLITQLSNIRLLVDSDDDFSNAQALGLADGLTFSVINGRVTAGAISSVHLANNTTNYITIGYMDVDYTIQGSSAICAGDEGWIVIDLINSAGPISISYTDGANNFTLNNVLDGDTLFISPTSNTTYTFDGLGGLFNCCLSAGGYQHTQIVNPKPTVGINTASSNICVGEQLTLNGTGANTYQWDNGVINNHAFSPTQSSLYTVIGTNNFGCSDTASMIIDVYQYPVLSLVNPVYEICNGNTITYNAVGAQTYIWNNGIQNGFAFTPGVGNYTNEVIGFNGNCSDTLSVNLIVYEQPTADAVADITNGVAPLTVNFTNFSSNALTYDWDFGNGQTSTSNNAVSTTYNDGGSYYVTLTATNEICTDTWTETIVVEPGDVIINVPNVFSPNGDGYNDTYFLETENIIELNGSILNRWGNVMFQFNTVDFVWDGTSAGAATATDGVYTIIYTAKGKNGDEIAGQGFINLYK